MKDFWKLRHQKKNIKVEVPALPEGYEICSDEQEAKIAIVAVNSKTNEHLMLIPEGTTKTGTVVPAFWKKIDYGTYGEQLSKEQVERFHKWWKEES